MEVTTVHENIKRKIIKISNGNNYSYAWIDENGLIMDKARLQSEETRLVLTKEELQNLFPGIKINTDKQRHYNGNNIVLEECTLIK